ncbi:MAG: RNA methyltransferase [Candidatus Cryptobacteroides sp.]|nr:RNA methyltransferase [Candidatus Cryptobacteroides sp.]
MRVETITSAQNPKIKNLLLLQEKSKARREQGLFVVEGARELSHCLEAGYTVKTIFICPAIADGLTEEGVVSQISGHPRPDKREGPAVEPLVIELPEQLYRKVAYRESTEGILAEVEYKTLGLKNLQLPENPLIMVLESVEKPGNLGAVLRSADAAKADAVLICDPLTDLYNPNLIRASIGAIFTVPTAAVSSEEAIAFLQARDIQILTAQLQDSSLYYDVDMKRGTALVMGTESTGLTPLWRKAATSHIRIPMLGRLDSLNVSVSAAILLFEAVRQRQG